MTRAEREADPGESFDGGYHLYAKEKHKERVAKNSECRQNLSEIV